MVVGQSDHGDWHPGAAVDSKDQLHVAWDAYDGESFNVYLRVFDGVNWSDRIDVACSPAFEGRTDLAVDSADRIWIAWEEGGTHWGQPFRGIDTEKMNDEVGPLHRFRLIRLAVLDANQNVSQLKDSFPMPSIDAARADRTSARCGAKWCFLRASEARGRRESLPLGDLSPLFHALAGCRSSVTRARRLGSLCAGLYRRRLVAALSSEYWAR